MIHGAPKTVTGLVKPVHLNHMVKPNLIPVCQGNDEHCADNGLGDSRPRALPQTQYLSITTVNLPAVRKKITELNDSASADVALSSDEVKHLENLVKQLQSSPTDPKPQPDQLSVVIKIISKWSPANRLPGLDLLRLCAMASSFAMDTSGGEGTVVDTLEAAGVFAADTDKPNNTMLAVRTLANMFNTEEGRFIADGCYEQIVGLVKPFAKSSNKNLATAIATLYINFAVLLTAGAPSDESATREKRAAAVYDDAMSLVEVSSDSEATYRGLVALGTFQALGDEFRKTIASERGVGKLLDKVSKGPLGKEKRIQAVVQEMRDQFE